MTSLVAGAPTAATETYATTAGSNRLAAVTSASGTRSLGYDRRGNLASESRPGLTSAQRRLPGYACTRS